MVFFLLYQLVHFFPGGFPHGRAGFVIGPGCLFFFFTGLFQSFPYISGQLPVFGRRQQIFIARFRDSGFVPVIVGQNLVFLFGEFLLRLLHQAFLFARLFFQSFQRRIYGFHFFLSSCGFLADKVHLCLKFGNISLLRGNPGQFLPAFGLFPFLGQFAFRLFQFRLNTPLLIGQPVKLGSHSLLFPEQFLPGGFCAFPLPFHAAAQPVNLLVVFLHFFLLVRHAFLVGGILDFLMLLPFLLEISLLESLYVFFRRPGGILGIIQLLSGLDNGFFQYCGLLFQCCFLGGQFLSFRGNAVLIVPDGKSGG